MKKADAEPRGFARWFEGRFGGCSDYAIRDELMRRRNEAASEAEHLNRRIDRCERWMDARRVALDTWRKLKP